MLPHGILWTLTFSLLHQHDLEIMITNMIQTVPYHSHIDALLDGSPVQHTLLLLLYRKSGNFHVKIIHVLNIHFNLFLWVYGTHKNILT